MKELVEALVRNPGSARWESWLTVLSRALADERDWIQTFESLSLEDQFGLLKALRTDGNIYSDALRIITARHAELIRDEEVRDFLLTDASEATERLTNQLAQHRDELLKLIGRSEIRQHPHYDLATEVAHLERQLQELRKSEIGEKAQAIEELDREIHRLEIFKRTLESYDVEARRAYKKQLQTETTKLGRRRKDLEDRIAAQIGKRDTMQRELAASEHTLGERTREVEELSAEVVEAAKRIEAATAALDDAGAHLAGLTSKQRLRYDVGLEFALGGELAKELKATPGEIVLLTPILAQRSDLPARFDSKDYNFYIDVPAADSLDVKVVIDDDSIDPFVHVWKSGIPVSLESDRRCSVIVSADTGGALAVTLRDVNGHEVSMPGRLKGDFRRRSTHKARRKARYQRRITPQQFKEALGKVRAGGSA